VGNAKGIRSRTGKGGKGGEGHPKSLLGQGRRSKREEMAKPAREFEQSGMKSRVIKELRLILRVDIAKNEFLSTKTYLCPGVESSL